jgi:hypothetical protein
MEKHRLMKNFIKVSLTENIQSERCTRKNKYLTHNLDNANKSVMVFVLKQILFKILF